MGSNSGDPLLVLKFLIHAIFCLFQLILLHISEPALTPSVIGIILLLLAEISMTETFLLYLFGLLRLTLSVIMVCLIWAQLISWLSSNAPPDQREQPETIQNMKAGSGNEDVWHMCSNLKWWNYARTERSPSCGLKSPFIYTLEIYRALDIPTPSMQTYNTPPIRLIQIFRLHGTDSRHLLRSR